MLYKHNRRNCNLLNDNRIIAHVAKYHDNMDNYRIKLTAKSRLKSWQKDYSLGIGEQLLQQYFTKVIHHFHQSIFLSGHSHQA